MHKSNYRRLTKGGPNKDPTPKPMTKAAIVNVPANSWDSVSTFLGPSIIPTFPRYPLVKLERKSNTLVWYRIILSSPYLNTASKQMYIQSAWRSTSLLLLLGATLQAMMAGMNTLLVHTARHTKTSVHLPGLGHWLSEATDLPSHSQTAWSKKQLKGKKSLEIIILKISWGLTKQEQSIYLSKGWTGWWLAWPELWQLGGGRGWWRSSGIWKLGKASKTQTSEKTAGN